jgi:hypothetical protein
MLRAAGAFDQKKYDKKGKQLKDPWPCTDVYWGDCAEAYPFATMFR